MAPSLNAWIYNIFKFSEEFSKSTDATEEWNDLTLIRLLAEALEWNDEQVPSPEKPSTLADVRIFHRNLSSCPSCKLMLTLLRFISEVDNSSLQGYHSRTISASKHFPDVKTRKLAMIALLSHWQTIICNQIQLADHAVADKYKCIPDAHLPVSDVAAAQNEGETATPQEDNEMNGDVQIVPKNINELENGMSPDAKVDGVKAAKPLPSARGSTTFQPGHRRGPSTATNLSVAVNEKEPSMFEILTNTF